MQFTQIKTCSRDGIEDTAWLLDGRIGSRALSISSLHSAQIPLDSGLHRPARRKIITSSFFAEGEHLL